MLLTVLSLAGAVFVPGRAAPVRRFILLVALAVPLPCSGQEAEALGLVDQPTWDLLGTDRDNYAGDTIFIRGECRVGSIQPGAPALPWLRSPSDTTTADYSEAILLMDPRRLGLECTGDQNRPVLGAAVGLFVPHTVYLGIIELVLPFPETSLRWRSPSGGGR